MRDKTHLVVSDAFRDHLGHGVQINATVGQLPIQLGLVESLQKGEEMYTVCGVGMFNKK